MNTIEIITTGSELIQGEVTNTNATYISRELTRKGFSVLYHTAVGDEMVSLGGVIERAVERVDLVIITGGLGPTRDDATREAVALACHRKLVLNKESQAHIQELFRCRHQEMPESNLRQALLPEGATIIPNRIGTAPGFALSQKGREIICLPGVPEEMKKMFQEWVIPHLERLIPRKRHTLLRKIHVFGLPEALVGEKIAYLMAPEANPRAGTMVREGIITLRLQAEAGEEARAKSMLDGAEAEVRRLLGEAVFGVEDETLEDVVASLLMKHGLTIAVAESCTGGLVCDLLTNVPGISKHLLEGVVVYTVRAKSLLTGLPEGRIEEMGTVTPEITKLLASSVRERTGADIGLAVTGVAGPTSVTAPTSVVDTPSPGIPYTPPSPNIPYTLPSPGTSYIPPSHQGRGEY
ncbi:MAG: competence/damage-inducible protein A, partial [Candidatus Brocadiaceae bacterium]|nr:competence/damage-inducible protein A [Candidatus Brocadiaceae bacterium]